MIEIDEKLLFTFNYITEGGSLRFLSTKGIIDQEGLQLGKESIPFHNISDTIRRQDRLIIRFYDPQSLPPKINKRKIRGTIIVMRINSWNIGKIEKTLKRISSSVRAERARNTLEKTGDLSQFKTGICPNCSSTIDLTGFNDTELLYCHYCKSLFNKNGELVDNGEQYKICNNCGMYDRVKLYTEFYFYFLIFIYGFSYKHRHLCINCAGRIFIKAFLLNLLFVIGIVPAIWIKIQSLLGQDSKYQNLSKANQFASKGKFREASAIYSDINSEFGKHPGVLRNEAIGYLFAGEKEKAIECLKSSLDVCGNFIPSLQSLKAISEIQDKDDQQGI